ncbi:MAG TPA: SRPBCC family protein [Flavobacterium sp.]|jgi:uncharacterized protein YndB with AHSA1/START domain
MSQSKITVQATIDAPVATVWKVWNTPDDIIKWNTADPGWHTPASKNDLRVGGRFRHRMEAKDGSFGFDFEGVYDTVDLYQEISYTMDDGRRATTIFTEEGNRTHVATTFDAETQNDVEMQKQGWQAIVNNFAKFTESNYNLTNQII